MTKQIQIKINSKYKHIITEFKKAIISLEGGYYGFLGDYVIEALEMYLHNMKHYPEKIGKEKHTVSNLTKTKQRTKKFNDFFSDSLQMIKNNGMPYYTFYKLLKNFFKKSDKTIKEYQNDILTECNWSIINIPKSRKKLVLSRYSDLYFSVQRFDETLGNYYSGLRPNVKEKIIFDRIRKNLLPIVEDKDNYNNDYNIEEEHKNITASEEADLILGSIKNE